MVRCEPLDTAGRAAIAEAMRATSDQCSSVPLCGINVKNLLLSFACLLLGPWSTFSHAQADQAAPADQLFQQERWEELVHLVQALPDRPAELQFKYGVALARLQRWQEAEAALRAGMRLAPADERFPVELAGVSFRQKKYGVATGYLHRALRLDPKDAYANDFLATVYYLRGNLEAAVKYWNRADGSPGKPRIHETRNDPPLRLRPALLDHAFAFSPAAELELDDLRATEARLHNLEIFPSSQLELVVRPEGNFDAVLHAQEMNGFGHTTLEALLRTFRGLPFQEITPEYFNLRDSATNVSSLERWDPDKRRAFVSVSGPFGFRSSVDPRWRYTLTSDARNENWDIRNGFTGPAPVLASLNLRRESFSAQISRLVGWRWKWSLGTELSHRDYRNVMTPAANVPELAIAGFQLKQTAALRYEIWRSPEHRVTAAATASSQTARVWSQPSHSSGNQGFEKLQASLEVRWFPRAQGDDYATLLQARTGRSFGQLPFDELFMLGLERDNDLWMRGHIGVRDGRKGSAPLGRNYFLGNWETDKNLYSNGLFAVTLGPFVDTGKITDPGSASMLGSEKWLWDSGAQAKLRFLGVGVVFSYGKDLRTGNNAFFTTVGR